MPVNERNIGGKSARAEEMEPDLSPGENGAAPRSFSKSGTGKPGEHDNNIIRNKTFTPEFRQLVDKIIGSGPDIDDCEQDPGTIDQLTDEELLTRMYRLYYKTKILIDNSEANTAFKPFSLYRSPGKPLAGLADYIKRRMEELSFPGFAILSYSVPQKGYVPVVYSLDKYPVGNIVISVRSGLFKKIFTAPEGILLDGGTIQNDVFLKKIFSPGDGAVNSLYFAMTSFMTSELEDDLAMPDREGVFPFLPSSICMVEIPESETRYDAADITALLKNRMPVPLFLINENQPLDIVSASFNGLTYPFYLVDYFFSLFLVRKENVGISITLSGTGDTSTGFIMKYVISKFKHILSMDSAIIHLFKNRFIILTQGNYVDSITGIINEHNSLFNEKLSHVMFYAKDYDDSMRIIQEIILNN